MKRLREWNPWWEGKSTLPSNFISRHITKKILHSIQHKNPLFLTGISYSGKTAAILQLIQEHYPEALYIPLSDPYFNPTSLSQYVKYYLQEINPSHPIIILDDVEHPIEPIPDIKMILISSHNHPTSLSLYPLSLLEMLQVKDPQSALEHYLTYGGFPAVYLSQNKLPLLTHYYNSFIEHISSHYYLPYPITKAFMDFLALSTPAKFTLKSLEKRFGEFASKLIKAFEEIHLLYRVPIFSWDESLVNKLPWKAYLADPGLNYLVKQEKGKALEHAVFLELIKKGYKVRYYQGTKECNFIVYDEKPLYAIQVSWEEHPRALEGLEEATSVLDIPGLFITSENLLDQLREL